MKECVTLADRTALEKHVRETWSPFAIHGEIRVEAYCGADDRIGWEKTFIVLVGGVPVGFTDAAA